MNTKWKVLLGIALVAGLMVAQQPIQIQTVANGGALNLGHGVASGSLRVELPTDGTGTVGLIAGNAVIGHVIVDTAPSTAVTGTFNPTPQSTSTYAQTDFDLSATAATQVKGSAGNVWGFYGYNPNVTTCFLQFYNSTSASLGTSPLHPFGVPAGSSFVFTSPIALANYTTGISTGETTTATGSSQCSSAMVITILYN